MMKKEIVFLVGATHKDLIEIKSLLKSEFIETDEGFYNQMRLIDRSYNNGDLKVFKILDVIVAFTTVNDINNYTIELPIFWVDVKIRSRGIGRKCLRLLEKYYASNKILKFQVESLNSSLNFWLKNGFSISSDDTIYNLLYKNITKIND